MLCNMCLNTFHRTSAETIYFKGCSLRFAVCHCKHCFDCLDGQDASWVGLSVIDQPITWRKYETCVTHLIPTHKGFTQTQAFRFPSIGITIIVRMKLLSGCFHQPIIINYHGCLNVYIWATVMNVYIANRPLYIYCRRFRGWIYVLRKQWVKYAGARWWQW